MRPPEELAFHAQVSWSSRPGDGCFLVEAANNELVAKVEGGNQSTDEAHARLIAAAPDLLAALKDIVNSDDLDEVRESPILDLARSVIAKAEGR